MRIHREPFDPDCEFVWLKSTTFAGQQVRRGDPVDKSAIDPRRLRQFYGADASGRAEAGGRMIGYADGQVPRKPRRGPPVGAVGPTDLEHPGECGRFPAEGQQPAKKRGVARRRAA